MSFQQLGEAIDTSVNEGRLPNALKPQESIKLYRRRLHWLGYLSDEEGEDLFDEPLNKAICLFQRDLNIKITGRQNQQTFHALDALVAFEPLKENNSFLQQLKQDNLALIKAKKLRLSLYGLLKDGTKASKLEMQKAMTTFRRVLICLSIPNVNGTSTVKELEKYLFNLDLISKNINGDKNHFEIKLPKKIRKSDKTKLLSTVDVFIRNIASIELWLYGYDINLARLARGKIDIASPLKKFWREAPSSERPKISDRSLVTCKFFKRINKLQDINIEAGEKEVSTEILQRFENESFRQSIEQAGNSVFSRLWDGAKRLVIYIFDFFKRALNQAVTFIKNVARWFIAKARSVFQSISSLFRAARIGFIHSFQRVNTTNPSSPIIFRNHFDFDQSVYVNAKAKQEQIDQVMKKRGLAVLLFKIGLKGILIIYKIFKRLLSTIVTSTWMVLFWSLVKVKDSVVEIEHLTEEAKRALKKWEIVNKLK